MATLKVVTTTPGLASLVKQIGGQHIQVSSLVKGSQSAHHVEVMPHYVASLNKADLLILIGLDLELGWLPTAIRQSRNVKIQPNQSGYLDASEYIVPVDIYTGIVNRGMGHIHAKGNPHYLSDPSQGLLVANGIQLKLKELIPEKETEINTNYNIFKKSLGAYLLGEELIRRYDVIKLLELHSYKSLISFLESKNELSMLGGVLKRFEVFKNKVVIQDHNNFSSLIRFLRLKNGGTLEPQPGVVPDIKSLSSLVKTVNNQSIATVIYTPSFNKKLLDVVKKSLKCSTIKLGVQMNALEHHENYLDWVKWTLDQLHSSLSESHTG